MSLDATTTPFGQRLRAGPGIFVRRARSECVAGLPRSPVRCPLQQETMAELAEPPLLSHDQVDQRYTEAVVTAVSACAVDTAGQTCFICMDGAGDEGLVRGCACRGAAGFAHVSCLARLAQVAVERGTGPGWDRWHECGLCEQEYHGVVACALGWACWKTYVGRPPSSTGWVALADPGSGRAYYEHAGLGLTQWEPPAGFQEEDEIRSDAMQMIGNSFSRSRSPRGRIVSRRGQVGFATAHCHRI